MEDKRRKIILLSFEKKAEEKWGPYELELVMFHKEGYNYKLLATKEMQPYCHVSEYINRIDEVIKEQGWTRRDIVFTNCIPSKEGLNSYQLDGIEEREILYKGIVEGFFADSPL